MPLVTSTEMFKKAYNGGYAVGAFNVNNMEIVQGITEACQEEHAPVTSMFPRAAAPMPTHLPKSSSRPPSAPRYPIVLIWITALGPLKLQELRHGGFTSFMTTLGHSSPRTSRSPARSASTPTPRRRRRGELGTWPDDDEVSPAVGSYTVRRGRSRLQTNCDSLAIAIGTTRRLKVKPICTRTPRHHGPARRPLESSVSRPALPGFPIVLPALSGPQDYVNVNTNGGKSRRRRRSEDQLPRGAKLPSAKITRPDLLCHDRHHPPVLHEHPTFDRASTQARRANIKESSVTIDRLPRAPAGLISVFPSPRFRGGLVLPCQSPPFLPDDAPQKPRRAFFVRSCHHPAGGPRRPQAGLRQRGISA